MNWNNILADAVTEDNVTSTNTTDEVVTNNKNNTDRETNPQDDENIADSDRIIFSSDFNADPFKKSGSGKVNHIDMIKKLLSFSKVYSEILKYNSKIILHFHATDLSMASNGTSDKVPLRNIEGTSVDKIIGAAFVTINIHDSSDKGIEKHVNEVDDNDTVNYFIINVYYQKDILDYQLLLAHCHELCHALSFAKLIGKNYTNGNLSIFKGMYASLINTNEMDLVEHIEIGNYKGVFKNLCESVMSYLINIKQAIDVVPDSNGKATYFNKYLSGEQIYAVYFNFYNLFVDGVLSMVEYYYHLDNDHAPINYLIFYCDVYGDENDIKDHKWLKTKYPHKYKYPNL